MREVPGVDIFCFGLFCQMGGFSAVIHVSFTCVNRLVILNCASVLVCDHYIREGGILNFCFWKFIYV